MAQHQRRTACKLAFAALFACFTAPAIAQVPLPSARPTASQAQANATGARTHRQARYPCAKPPGRTGAPIAEPGRSILSPLCSANPPPRITLSAEQRAIVDRVNGYLSGVQALSGKFIQVGPDGAAPRATLSSPSQAGCASNTTTRAP